LSGSVGSYSAQSAEKIARVVILGNSIHKDLDAAFTNEARDVTTSKAITTAVAELDEILDNIAYKGMGLDVIPG
jgi:hypothetical protein